MESEPSKSAHSPVHNKDVASLVGSALWSSRLLVIFAVVPSIFAAVVLFVIGTVDIVMIAKQSYDYYFLGQGGDIHDTVVPSIIMAVDIYLIAVVLLIFGSGLHRLFIAPVSKTAPSDISHPFLVHSFDHLKDKIARVVILAVIIEFFRAVVDIQFKTPMDAILLAVAILALAAGLFLMSKAH